jgi:putative Holliday junction resolvase
MPEPKYGRVLAIDVGSVRVGLALSDELRMTAQPLEVLKRQPKKKLMQRIREIVESADVKEIVVGLPLNLKGEDTPSTTDARKFAANLEKLFPELPLTLWDERMTTSASESMLIDAGMRREKRREVVDKIAAAIILESYLRAKG